MKKELILDMWISGYTIEEIIDYSSHDEKSIIAYLQEELKDISFEDTEPYISIYEKYNISQEFFTEVIDESLYYSYLRIFKKQGNEPQLLLLNEEQFKDKVYKYLESNHFNDIHEVEDVSKSIIKKYDKGKELTKEELDSLPLIYEEKFVYYFINFDIEKSLFMDIFRLDDNSYVFLDNKYEKGTEDFENFASKYPDSQYSIRYSLSKKISRLNIFSKDDENKEDKKPKKLTEKLASLFVVHVEEDENNDDDININLSDIEHSNKEDNENIVEEDNLDIDENLFDKQEEPNNLDEDTDDDQLNSENDNTDNYETKEISKINNDSLEKLRQSHNVSKNDEIIEEKKEIEKVAEDKIFDLKETKFKQVITYAQEKIKPRFDVKKVVK